ncbi:MAG: EamA family transporter, partial [Pseudomonadota bacterium]
MLNLSTRQSGILYALVTACGLGAITTQAKLVYADGGNALTLMLLRFLVSVIAFGLILLIGRHPFKVAADQRTGLFLVGIIWSSAMICYLLSVERISVSLAVLILYTYPLQVLAYALLRHQLNPSVSLIVLFVG